MFDIIIAHNRENGIGLNGKIPWKCPDDLNLFREKTENSILIMGRKTVENLPKLENRIIYCISRKETLNKDNNSSVIFSDFDKALETASKFYPYKKVFIAGGAEIYNLAFSKKYMIDRIHISCIYDDTICDTHFNIYSFLDLEWLRISCSFEEGFIYSVYRRENKQENSYLELLSEILSQGIPRIGRNGETKSLFGKNMTFDLRKGFPLLTTKKMFFRGIVEELLFFLKGETDSKILEQKGVKIWQGNTSREFLDKLGMTERNEGIMGPLYGYQWRFFNAKYDEKSGKAIEKGVDQLKLVIDTIRKDPYSRRIMMTDYNPSQVSECVLYPCHSIIIQFYVVDGFLDMFCYNRSQDLFLGTPFNIASSALLLTIIAKVTNLNPRFLYMSLGDVHIYKPHYNLVCKQLTRRTYQFPKLVINKNLKELEDIESLVASDVVIENYISHSAIKAEMVV